MSQINIRNLSNENEDGAPDIVGVSTFSATSYMVPPVGTTAQRPQNPQGGDLRFNTDTASLEYFKGDTIGWSQIEMTSPDLNGGARGLAMGGELQPGAGDGTIDYVTISTLGNAQDFGDLTQARGTGGACASTIRAYCLSGYGNSPVTYSDVIDFVTISSTGNATDYGDLAAVCQGVDVLSNRTRGIFTSGSNGTAPAYGITNVLTYINLSTSGTLQDFGDQQRTNNYSGTCASSTRGIIAGGYDPYNTVANTFEYLTIATTGNTLDFGDIGGIRRGAMGISNSTRGVFAGGITPSYLNNIAYITIATLGNGVEFGDLSNASGAGRYMRSTGMASPTRGLFQGGNSNPLKINDIDYIEIATTSNSIDFGDLTAAKAAAPGCSNAHGGL